jgi:riboflavin kinase/FMN adenylyltransferase
MNLYRAFEEIELAADGRAVAVGMFDGVHIGHRALLARLVDVAAADGLRACVLTFEHHPLHLLRPDLCPPLITDWCRKIDILDRLGVAEAVVIAFDREFASLSAEAFIRDVLHGRLNARVAVCGAGFRFGRGAEGSLRDLLAVGGPLGMRAEVVELVKEDGLAASSTAIRDAIHRGDVAAAARMLGEPFVLTGVVEPGEGRGARLGFPTANLAVPGDLVIPGEGVYACQATLGGGRWDAVVSVGERATFGGGKLVIEAHLIDYAGEELYGCSLDLAFVQRLRGQIRYDDAGDLVRQMQDDARRVRELLAPAVCTTSKTKR